MRVLILLGLVASSTLTTAQTTGSCVPGGVNGLLDASGVEVRLFTQGSIGYGPGFYNGNGYFVPRRSGRSPVYASFFRVAGRVGGDVRAVGTSFRTTDWSPGPLDVGATLPSPSGCSAFDRVWVVSKADVDAYNRGAAPSADLREWPIGLGAPTVDARGRRVTPEARQGIIGTAGLAAGLRPVLSGSQTAFCVMNDVGAPHSVSQTAPLGVEVRATAFVVASPDPAFDQAVFLRYEIVNRNRLPVEAAHAGFFVDHDLGQASDDYAATDTTRGMAYAYNANDNDSVYGIPPAHGIDLLDGLGASVATYNASADPTNTPTLGADVYDRMRGLWNDGTPVREGGTGYGGTGHPTQFSFAGDPVAGAFWSNERITAGGGRGSPGNIFIDLASPAFSLQPGETHVFNAAMLFAQGSSRLNSVVRLRAASDAIQAAYGAGGLFPVAGEAAPTTAPTAALGAPRPNPARSDARLDVSATGPSLVRVVDVLGRVVAEVPLGAGAREVRVDVRRLPGGVYTVVLSGDGVRAVQTLTVIR